MKTAKVVLLLWMAILGMYFSTIVYAGDNLLEALKEGKPYADVRIRYEFVDDDSKAEHAHAKTVRTKLGYKSGDFYNFNFLVEGEDVAEYANDDYNNTINGKVDHATVADVESKHLNQAFLAFSGVEDTTIKGGRQVIALDNQRFIGHVGWRQNNQTFDAATIENKSIPDTTIKYGHIWNVNRIFGEDSTVGEWESDSHFVNISNSSLPIGTFTGYGYWLDFEMDSTANSSETYGISFSGKQELADDVTGKLYAEYAHQEDYAGNTTNYDAGYFHIAPALVVKGITTTIGYEVLESDNGTFAFRTPLATGHKWNGWSDKFLTTPANGLEDVYVDVTYKVKDLEGFLEFLNKLLVKVQYHEFSAENGGADYGDEWGVFLKKPINENVWASVKYSNYEMDTFSADTEKVTFDMGFKF